MAGRNLRDGKRRGALAIACATAIGLALPAAVGAAPPAEEPRRVVVFFEPGAAELTPQARAVAEIAATRAREARRAQVEVTGFVSPGEPGGAEVARERAAAVADLLVEKGLSAGTIRVAAAMPRDGSFLAIAPEAGNRAEIVVHPVPAYTAGLNPY